jgi:hypothetical protein
VAKSGSCQKSKADRNAFSAKNSMLSVERQASQTPTPTAKANKLPVAAVLAWHQTLEFGERKFQLLPVHCNGASALSSARLNRMNKDGVGIGWPMGLCQVQRMANGASVIAAVIDEVKEDFLTGQGTALAVNESETHGFLELIGGERADISLNPFVRYRQPLVKLGQRWNGIGICCQVGLAASQQPGAEQLFHPHHVIQLLA